jgi:hypothetical protein
MNSSITHNNAELVEESLMEEESFLLICLLRWSVEQPNGVFAVVAADLAKLVEYASSERSGNFLVAGVDGF